MNTTRWISIATVGVLCALVAGSAYADTIITFTEGAESGPEHIRTVDGRRLCFTCPTGISEVLLFEPDGSTVSDFVIAETHLAAFGFVDTNFFFESERDLLFFATHSPLIRNEVALFQGLRQRALAGLIPITIETGSEQVLSDPAANINLFRRANGALAPLPSDIFSGGFVVKVTSDKDLGPEIPEPATMFLFRIWTSRSRCVASTPSHVALGPLRA